jgi:hypothetical protein
VRRKNSISPRRAAQLENPRGSGDTRSWAVVANFAGADLIAATCGGAMTDDDEAELRSQLARLRQEHRDLDAAISALQDAPGSDILQVQRLKKRKLWLRDRITFIEDQLTPDIIA